MKNYNEMAASVLRRRDEYVADKKMQAKRITAVASCFCLCALLGIGVWQSGVFNSKLPVGEEESSDEGSRPAETKGDNSEIGLTIGATKSPASVDKTEQNKPAETKDDNIEREFTTGTTKVLLSVDRDKTILYAAADLTQEALYEQMGEFLPKEAPEGFSFESASFSDYGYSVLWSRGLEDLNWKIRDYNENDARCITDIEDTENYDLSLYPIPRAESVPEELMEIVNDPIFRAEDLTQEVVYSRAYKVDAIGDTDGYRMMFSVLYKNKVISIVSKGVSPEWLYNQLSLLFK